MKTWPWMRGEQARKGGPARAMGALFGLTLAAFGCGGAQPQRPGQASLDADPPLTGAPSAIADADLQRGIAYIKNEKFADAIPFLEKAVANQPKSAEAVFYLGLAKERSEDRAGGEELYKKALALDPTFAEAAENLAALYLEDPPRPDEAIQLLDGALEKSPGNVRLLTNLAYAYGLKGDVESASKHYEAAIAKGDSFEVRFAYGSMLVDAKQPEKAAPHLKKALETAKDDPALLATLGGLLGFAKAFGECVQAYDRALKQRQEPEWLVRRGTCRHELKDEPGARSDYEAAVKANPKFAAGHYYLGLSLASDKKRTLAMESLEQAVKLEPEGKIGKAAKEKLAALKAQKR